jgi:hypothetical protein
MVTWAMEGGWWSVGRVDAEVEVGGRVIANSITVGGLIQAG